METQNAPIQTDNFENLRSRAETAFARKLSAQTIGDENSQQFVDARVKIDTGLPKSEWNANEEHNETLRLTIQSNMVESNPSALRKAIEQTIQSIEPMDEWVRARSAEQEVAYVKSKVEELINAGADLSKSILKWAGFDSKNEQRYEVQEYLISTHNNNDKFDVNLCLPEHLSDGLTSEKIAENIRKRLNDIKEMLAQRLIKAKNITNEIEKKELTERVNQLDFHVIANSGYSSGGDVSTGSVNIEIRSPKQLEKYEESKEKNNDIAVHDDDTLKKTNLLSDFDTLAVSKALSRAIQTAGGEKAEEVMPAIAGASDIRRKLEKVLSKFEQEHPEHAHKVADVLHSNVLVRGWSDECKKFTKEPVHYIKDADSDKRGTMIVEMTLPEGKAAQVIQKLAAMQPALSPEQQSFASVDGMQLVGAQSQNPVVQKKLMVLLKPLMGQQVNPQNQDELKPFAEKLIAAVTEAHASLEEMKKEGVSEANSQKAAQNIITKMEHAYNTITEGVKRGANIRQNEEKPSPVVTPDWIQKLAARTSDVSPNYTMGA